jgi:hypothetical protein
MESSRKTSRPHTFAEPTYADPLHGAPAASGAERRRDTRARISVPVSLLRRGSVDPVEMIDASYRGLFLRMDEPPPVRQLVRLCVSLPGRDLVMHAVVVRLVDDMLGRAGVGLRFFALNGHDKADWEAFIAEALRELRRAA